MRLIERHFSHINCLHKTLFSNLLLNFIIKRNLNYDVKRGIKKLFHLNNRFAVTLNLHNFEIKKLNKLKK